MLILEGFAFIQISVSFIGTLNFVINVFSQQQLFRFFVICFAIALEMKEWEINKLIKNIRRSTTTVA